MGKKDLLKLTLACWLALIGWVNSGCTSDVEDRCQQLCKNGQYEQAFPVCSEAAEQGDVKTQNILGLMYDSGKGVQQDYAEAAKWYRKAAEQGYADAQYNLGGMYANGEGVQQDDTEAVKWYRKAAEHGDAGAQYNLGGMYRNGEGVQQDDTEAIKWYRKAAEQGVAKAQYNLGVMYALGHGVLKSGAAAADWFYRAGFSFLKEGKKDDALMCAERIKDMKTKMRLNVPNSFLADKLLTAIYGSKEGRK